MNRFDTRRRASSLSPALLRRAALASLATLFAACGDASTSTEPHDDNAPPIQVTPPANSTACAPYPAASATDSSSGTKKTYYRYRPTAGSISWMDAKTSCQEMGGKLAVPTSSTENNTILGLASSQEMWIGFFQPWNQSAVNQNWQTIDGAAIGSFHYWASGQPNDSDNIENNGQNCTYMIHTSTSGDTGKWNDWPCYQTWNFDYVCEFDGTSTPSTCATANACELATGATSFACVSCSLGANTTATATTNTYGCPILTRDASACKTTRSMAGLSGYWLKFSCRVGLSVSNGAVVATADGQPDYASDYFPTTGNSCYEVWMGENARNSNNITAQSYAITFPPSPNTSPVTMQGWSVVGLTVNGVPIYGNFAAGTDDIYAEAVSFDRCSGHPESTGTYHYHVEPNSITNDDNSFVGVMRDGYPIYGRKDYDGSYPGDLDLYGGHSTKATADSAGVSVYHYHVNLQTSATTGTAGQKLWFLTTGNFRGQPGSCTGCSDPAH